MSYDFHDWGRCGGRGGAHHSYCPAPPTNPNNATFGGKLEHITSKVRFAVDWEFVDKEVGLNPKGVQSPSASNLYMGLGFRV